MAIKAHLDQTTATGGQRGARRRGLWLETSGFVPGLGEANVTIHNISAAGLLLETALALTEGERLALDLPEAGAVTAVVVWRSERLYGCAFEQALGPAALAAAQLQAALPPPLAPAPPSAMRSAPRTSPSEALGIRLNRLRREAGLTLADVATTLGVSKPTVWAWEKGKARPLPERLEAIAAALGVAPDLLAASEGSAGPSDVVIAECRERIAEAYGAPPSAVRIMIEL
jgi:transcriptional regulator with XRE-family HTH domain